MRKKYYNADQFSKKLKGESAFSGISSSIIGVMILGVFAIMGIDLQSPGLVLFGAALCSVFVAAGVYFFRRPQIMEKRDRDLDDPESRLYKKKQARLESKKEKILKNSDRHKSLRYILCVRATVLRSLLTFFAVIFTFLLLGAGFIAFGMLFVDIMGIVSVFRAVTGKHYRHVIRGYEVHGMDRSEAESDFAKTKAYINNFEVMSVSRRIFISTIEEVVLSVSSIVWVFAGYTKYDTFERKGLHSYTQRLHHLVIGLENGTMIQVYCPEELCSVLIEDIVREGNCITTGYSEEIFKIYSSDPENFRNAVKPNSGISNIPVNIALVP